MARFFFDLDGVLADFDAGCVATLGMTPRDFVELHGEELFWRRLSEAPDWYAGLGWCPGAREMFDRARAIIEGAGDVVMLLTGLPLGDWAMPQKRAWVERELPGTVVLCCLSMDKPSYCAPGDKLLDDRLSAEPGWRDAGGIFLHHRTPAQSLAAIEALYGG